MIGQILTSPSIYNLTQSTAVQVSIETGLKAVGRPGFILADNNIDKQTKKYSAMKELLFQLTCLVSALCVVIPVFKKGSFNIARKIFKDEAVFNAFKTSSEFNRYRKMSDTDKLNMLAEINSAKNTDYKPADINENLAKGMIEATSILGSVAGLSALAPVVSRPLVRPVLKMFGINRDQQKQPSQVTSQQTPREIAVA